jgi:GTP-binding protein EngB required for normal cell division
LDLDAALDGALASLDGIVDAGPLLEARALLARPWTVAAVGRVGAGKSSLVNALAGRMGQRTGLGGVTTELRRETVGAAVLIDTPGIDEPEAAIRVLEAALAEADAVVWIVDGLQPLAESERSTVEHVLPAGMPLHVVVSRADLLDPSEVGPVLDRVRDLTRPLRPSSVRVAALRSGDPALLGGILSPALPGPRRGPVVRDAIAKVRAALDALPRPPDEGVRVAAWRTAVQEIVRAVEQDIESGGVSDKTEALDALSRRAAAANVGELFAPAVPPPLPTAPTADTPLARIAASFSGMEGARRTLRAAAGRWLMEGEVALREAASGSVDPQVARRRRAEKALDRLAAVLAG